MNSEKIAIPTIDGIFSGHFGHCEYFTIVDVTDGKVMSESKISPPPHTPGAFPKFLAGEGVTAVISGGMGPKAQDIFKHHNINIVLGVEESDINKIVEDYLNDNLTIGNNQCNH